MDLALKTIPGQNIPGILVGFEHADDAGVFQLTDDICLVQTVDYFAPIVDDPHTYGQIAAANSLSDIYAMGGVPKTALSVVGFPTKGVDFSVLGEIMLGGLQKLNEAGVALLGGHSVRDDEIKFGYAVTGTIAKKDIKQNIAAREGNRLILTKLAKASGISIEIDHRKLPLLPGALEYSREGFCAGGLTNNREFFSKNLYIHDSIPPDQQNILFDPQTSGGLLIFSDPQDTDRLLESLRAAGVDAVEVGSAVRRAEHLLTVR